MSQIEKIAVKITVTYDDGTTKELEKGLVWCIADKPETREAEITAEMVSMSGEDLFTIVRAAIELGDRLGMFNGLEE